MKNDGLIGSSSPSFATISLKQPLSHTKEKFKPNLRTLQPEEPLSYSPKKQEKIKKMAVDRENMRLYSNILDINKKPQFGYLNLNRKFMHDKRRMLQEAGLTVKVPKDSFSNTLHHSPS